MDLAMACDNFTGKSHLQERSSLGLMARSSAAPAPCGWAEMDPSHQKHEGRRGRHLAWSVQGVAEVNVVFLTMESWAGRTWRG